MSILQFKKLLNEIQRSLNKEDHFEVKTLEYEFEFAKEHLCINGRKYETGRLADVYLSKDGFTLVLLYERISMIITWRGYIIYDNISVAFEYGNFNWGFSD